MKDKGQVYFSHDSNAKQDPKILKLRVKHGWEGYGLYWAVIELLRDQPEYKLQTDYDSIAYALQTHCDVIKSIIGNFDLFVIDENGYFYSESLLARMEIMERKSKIGTEAANARWDKHRKNADAMQTHSDSNANPMQIKEKKINENKEEGNEVSHNEIFKKLWVNRPWLESLAMLWKREIKEIHEHLNKFRLECISKADYKNTEKDAKEHFVNWTKYNPLPDQGYVYKRPDLSSLERNPF
jgi:hypothetical protein